MTRAAGLRTGTDPGCGATRERQVVIPSGQGRLAGVLHLPAGLRGAVLVCPPLFEERKSAARAMAELSRALCRSGRAVLRFDYRGCGDSTGAFRDHGVAEWLADVRAAHAFLAGSVPACPKALLGLRFGATLAVLAATCGQFPVIDDLVLWEPVVRGEGYVRDAIRRKLVNEMVTFGRSRSTSRDLLDRLSAGGSADLDGYELSSRVYRELCGIDLRSGVPALSARVLLLHVTARERVLPGVEQLRQALDAAASGGVTFELAAQQPFWNLVGYVPCDDMAEVTCGWLAGTASRPAGADQAGVVAGFPDEASAGVPEAPAVFRSEGETVHAFVHEPGAGADGGCAAVIFLHGWSGCRLGPHRMFVKAARCLRDAGWPCLRFDFRGRGGSDGETARAGVQSMIVDAGAAVGFARARWPGRPVVLLGMCSGAKVAIGTAVSVPVDGLVLWSAEPLGRLKGVGRNARKSAHALWAYAAKLTRRETWRKILAGRVNTRMVRKAVVRHESADRDEIREESRILDRFRAYRGQILFVYGGRDPDTAQAGTGYRRFCASAGLAQECHEIAEANHSFYALDWERQVIDLTADWLQRSGAGQAECRDTPQQEHRAASST